MISYQDYAAAHRKQQLDIWSAIECGEIQKAVDIFAAGIQYEEPAAKNGDKNTLTRRRKSGIIGLIRRCIRKILRRRKK